MQSGEMRMIEKEIIKRKMRNSKTIGVSSSYRVTVGGGPSPNFPLK